jgi:uncharacterized coiled-coil protein SlyX
VITETEEDNLVVESQRQIIEELNKMLVASTSQVAELNKEILKKNKFIDH